MAQQFMSLANALFLNAPKTMHHENDQTMKDASTTTILHHDADTFDRFPAFSRDAFADRGKIRPPAPRASIEKEKEGVGEKHDDDAETEDDDFEDGEYDNDLFLDDDEDDIDEADEDDEDMLEDSDDVN